jgi:hypothetical protein
MRVPLESIHFYVKVSKTGGKNFEVTVGLRKSHKLSVRHIIKVETIVFSESSLVKHKKMQNIT